MKLVMAVGWLLVGLPGAVATGAGLQVQSVFGPLVPEQAALVVDAVPRDDGSLLVAAGDAVFALDPHGLAKLLGRGERAVLDPAGRAFGLWRQDAWQVFDAGGQPLGELAAPALATFKLVPGGRALYAPRIRVQREFPIVESVRLVRPDGVQEADFPAPGLDLSRLLEDRIIYTLPDRLVARTLAGKELWTLELQAHKLEAAGERVIAVRRYVPGEVLHLEHGRRLSSAKVDGVVWNLAISKSGRFSAATTQTRLYVFSDGQLVASARLPAAYINTLDVSDRGEVLAGTQDAKGEAAVGLYDAHGGLLWSTGVGRDRAAYRPGVRFAPGGERFVVIDSRGLTAYAVSRSQP